MNGVTFPVSSTAANPALNWSQVRATIPMLGMAIAPVESAMKDSGESVETLAISFTSMLANVQVIAYAARESPDGPVKNNACGKIARSSRCA